MFEIDPDLDARLTAMGDRLQAQAEDLLATEMLDSVVILVTYREGSQTWGNTATAGNVYAARGQMREHLDKQ